MCYYKNLCAKISSAGLLLLFEGENMLKKILLTFLSLSMCFGIKTNFAYAGGRDYTIESGNKKTVYASHETLEKLVEAEKKQEEGQKLARDEFFKYFKYVPVIGQVGSIMKDITESLEKGVKQLFGDSTFLSSCRDKSATNGKRGCIMKYTYIAHDETPDEWSPDSCELQ